MRQTRTKALKPLIVVLGQYRGGTSAVTGVVKKLGGWGGHGDVRPPNISNPTGFHENPNLDSICKKFFIIPEHIPTGETIEKVEKLKSWREREENSSPEDSMFIVAKNPLLCLLTEEIDQAWPDARYIGVRRDLEHSCRSIVDRGWNWSEEQIENSISSMVMQRDRFLASRNCLWVEFESLLEFPELETKKIADFIGLGISEENAALASRTINPRLNRADVEKGPIGKISDWAYAHFISIIGRIKYRAKD